MIDRTTGIKGINCVSEVGLYYVRVGSHCCGSFGNLDDAIIYLSIFRGEQMLLRYKVKN